MASHHSEITDSEVIYPATTANGEASQSMIPAPLMAPPAPSTFGAPFGGGLPRGPEILTGSFNQTWMINCLRRKWLPAVLLGVLAAGVVAGVLLWVFPISSQVTAYLELKAEQSSDVFGRNRGGASAHQFRIFQQSQLTLFKSHFVLKAALARREIAELDAVVKQGDDALTWLTDNLNVGFPGKGEILEIRYDGEESSEDMTKIVDAVIKAYIQEILVKKSIQLEIARDKLKELHRKTAKELREKIDHFQTLAKELGGGDTPLASTMLRMLTREVQTTLTQISAAEAELIDLEIGMRVAKQQAESPSALQRGIEAALAEDPIMANFQDEKYAITQQIRQMQAKTRGGNSKQIKQMRQQYQRIEQEEQQHRRTAESDIRDRLKSAPNDMLAAMWTEYILRRDSVNKKLVELQAQYEEKMELIAQKGERSGKLAMLESEIEQDSALVKEMDSKLRNGEVEEETASERVQVMQPARAREKINKFERFAIACLGGIAAFCTTCYAVALLEFRRRRLNGPADVDEGLGIRVLGVLPSVSSRKAMVPGSPIAAQLSESIDNVRATLMHDSTSKPRQVVLVTSATSMEGCTTVASHLALSLTRAGRRTLLIDGDLREPSLHKLFGMPVEDGLSELLRAEIEVADALRPTSTEGLWLLTAGQCNMDAVHALAADQLQPIFEKLRSEFDFIVIDGAPVLGLSDSISIGQHVDGAILTVLRDHSEVRSIYQASELLKSMGIRLIGSVVNGVTTKADRRIARLHHLESQQQQRKLSANTGT